MMKRIYRILLLFAFISTFITLYFTILIIFYVPNFQFNFSSIIMLIGFTLVIITVFFYFKYNSPQGHEFSNKLTIPSEEVLNLCLIFSLSIVLFIPPVTFSKSVIDWNQIGFLNYVRAFVVILICGFVPGSCIYRIIFPNDDLSNRFKISPFILKITIYPLLSFSFIGFVILVLDQVQLNSDFFPLLLYLTILLFYLSTLIFITIKKKGFKWKAKIAFSNNIIILLLLSIGTLLTAIGFNLSFKYLRIGDYWYGNFPANFIGEPNINTIEFAKELYKYPIFWSYIIYGINSLSGLPFINTNVILSPFCYIFFLSQYLLFKVLTYEYEEKYSILATIFSSLFGGLFYFISNTGNISAINFLGFFEFNYKTISYYLFFIGLALFFIITKTTTEFSFKPIKKNVDLRILIFAALFLLESFMIYMYPLLVAIPFIFIYCIFSNQRTKNLKNFTKFIFLFIILFVIFDIVMNFYLSYLFSYFLEFLFIRLEVMNYLNFPFFYIGITYFLFGSFFILCILIEIVSKKYLPKLSSQLKKIKIDIKKIFTIFIVIFSILIIIEVGIIFIEDILVNHQILTKRIFFLYYIDLIIKNFGIIGILSMFYKFRAYLKNKQLFFVLICWIIFSLLLASLQLIYGVYFSAVRVKDLEVTANRPILTWFGRLWYHSVLPICLLASIEFIEFIKNSIEKKKFGKINKISKKKKEILKLFAISSLIFFTFSNTIIAGQDIAFNYTKVEDGEANIIGWASENLPNGAKILIETKYTMYKGLSTTMFCYTFYISLIMESDINQTEKIDKINYLIENEIHYMIIHNNDDYINSETYDFINNYLIPNFYNDTMHDYKGKITIYYAEF